MIHPDGTESPRNRPGAGRTALFVVAGLVIVVGFVAVGTLTSPDPTAIEPTTTTTTTTPEATTSTVEPSLDPQDFTVDQIVQGEQLHWQQAMILDDGYPVGLVEHDGWLYLFSTEVPNFSGYQEGGLRGWRSIDGAAWEPLGEGIGEAHAITSLAATGQGLVALEPGEGGDGFTLWRSHDGVTWTAEEVAIEGLNELQVFYPFAVDGTERLLVVSGTTHAGVSELVSAKLEEVYGHTVEPSGSGWAVDIFANQTQFTLYGPFGFPLAVVTADELGLSDGELDLIRNAYGDTRNNAETWFQLDGEEWQKSEIPDVMVVDSIMAADDGAVTAVGYGSSGPEAWTTRDGESWERTSSLSVPYRVDSWLDHIVGPSNTGQPSLLVSDDDGGWTDIGLSDYFPDEQPWGIGAFAGGPGGVAAIVIGWRSVAPPLGWEPPRLAADGTVLILDFAAGRYTLQLDDGSTRSWSMNDPMPDGIEVDLGTGSVVFHDPDTGESLASIDLEAISHAQASYSSSLMLDNLQAFTFTADGSDWTIQDLEAIGDDTEIRFLEVTESSVVAVGIGAGGLYDPTLSPGLEVWSAAIP